MKLSPVLTDRGTEYCGNPEHHEYELYLAVEDIDHFRSGQSLSLPYIAARTLVPEVSEGALCVRIQELGRVTALSPMIGYDKASAIAHKANDEGLTLKEAALQSSDIDDERFDEVVDPRTMVGHGVGGS